MIRRFRRSLVQTGYRLVEDLWATGFAIAGQRQRRRHLPQWTPGPARQRVLIVSPHPDDETIGCGGVIGLHRQAGDEVVLLMVTNGNASRAEGRTAAAMAEQRRIESERAGQILGLSTVVRLDWPEHGWTEDQFAGWLDSHWPELQPDLVYGPSCIDYHPVHRRVAGGLALALQRSTGDAPVIHMYQIHVPLTPVFVNLLVDIHRTAATKAQALAAYTSQADSITPLHRLARYERSYYGHDHDIEVFWQGTATQYQQLIQAGSQIPTSDFYGLRGRPFTDPLAYWVGRDRRRALKSILREA